MKRRWSDVFLEKPESSHVRSLFARIAGGKVKRRNNATFIIRSADAQDFTINRRRRNSAGAVHNAIEAGADIAERPVPRASNFQSSIKYPQAVLNNLLLQCLWNSSTRMKSIRPHQSIRKLCSFHNSTRNCKSVWATSAGGHSTITSLKLCMVSLVRRSGNYKFLVTVASLSLA